METSLRHQHEFINLARSFCATVESVKGDVDSLVFLGELRRVLPMLYACVWSLPLGRVEEVEVVGSVSQSEWRAAYQSLRTFLARCGLPDAAAHATADALGDIYGDLKAPLIDLDANRGVAEAYWDWHVTFTSHWGERVITALSQLHPKFVEV
jgi:hypothetical protein